MTALMVCGSGGSPARASEPCPAAVLTYWFHFSGGDTFISRTTLDTTIVNPDGDTTRVAFDRNVGRMTMSAVGRESAGERVVESFDVSGVQPGTAVPVLVTFDVDMDVLNNCGGGGCGVSFIATLSAGAESVVADASRLGPCDMCTNQVRTTLSLPITIIAGTPSEVSFAMLYHVTNVGWGRASATGLYGVSGLPEGVRAIACPGADVTPARSTSWGRLKSLYR